MYLNAMKEIAVKTIQRAFRNYIYRRDEWEQVYNQCFFHVVNGSTHMQLNGLYFQTYGGGPEGGIVLNLKNQLFRVHRNWSTPFVIEEKYVNEEKLILLPSSRNSIYPYIRIVSKDYEIKGDEIHEYIDESLECFTNENIKDMMLSSVQDL